MKKEFDDIPPYNSGVSKPDSKVNKAFKYFGLAVVFALIAIAAINSV